MSHLSRRITFVTPSLGTKWEPYSQALLRCAFPECHRIVVDGRRSWDPLFFVEFAPRLLTDYMVLVDEDCFVFDGAQLAALVATMDDEPDIAVTATPDGGTFHRDYNPLACNPFFAVIRRSAAVEATGHLGWRNLTFDDVRGQTRDDHLRHLDLLRMNYGLAEPYYPFFWAVLRAGFSIRYLIPRLNTQLLASELCTDDATTPMLVHMWWLRSWQDESPEMYLGVSNRSRYNRLERTLLQPRFRTAVARLALAGQQARRLLRTGPWETRLVVARLGRRLRGQWAHSVAAPSGDE